MGSIHSSVYRNLLGPILFAALSPAKAHRFAISLLKHLPPWSVKLMADFPFLSVGNPTQLRQELWGIEFPNCVGLAAGMDKDAEAIPAWKSLGFGFAEVGTITPRPQSGNPEPNMWRLVARNALANQWGFPSVGAVEISKRLRLEQKGAAHMRIGVNLGPNRDSDESAVLEDFAGLIAQVTATADFAVINVSSPNTAGLRNWQSPERLEVLIRTIRRAENLSRGGIPSEKRRKLPLLVKLSPDLSLNQISEICSLAQELELDGIVATNTTVKRAEIGIEANILGGVSGEPLAAIARECIQQIYEFTCGRIPIIGVGGVASARDAFEHIRAGASLVEVLTGLVYEGPGVASQIKRGLVRLLMESGYHSVSEAVGAATSFPRLPRTEFREEPQHVREINLRDRSEAKPLLSPY